MIDPTTNQPSSYLIAINEAQRKFFVDLLEKVQMISIDPNDEDLCYLLDMFKDLPKEEIESPNVIHGFCL